MTTNRFNEIHSDTIRAELDGLVDRIASCQGTLDHQAIIAGLDSVGMAVQAECQRVLEEEERAAQKRVRDRDCPHCGGPTDVSGEPCGCSTGEC